jgi:hypothetical protein
LDNSGIGVRGSYVNSYATDYCLTGWQTANFHRFAAVAKRIAAFILLFIFLFNSAGAGVLWAGIVFAHRDEVNGKIAPEAIVTIRVAAKNAGALLLLKNREIRFEGKRYDVKTVTQAKTCFIITALPDEEEDEMLREMKKRDAKNGDFPGGKKSSQKKGAENFTYHAFVLVPQMAKALNLSPGRNSKAPAVFLLVEPPPPWLG